MLSHTFSISERLKSRKTIATLFQKDKAKSFGSYPLRLIWVEQPLLLPESFLQAAFSVPKKNFKKANVRNTIKRRMREAYRLHKHLIFEALNAPSQQYALMWLYTGKEIMPYQEINQAMVSAIKRFIREIEKENPRKVLSEI